MNSKLIDMARLVLQRHAGKIADATDLLGMAEELKQRYGSCPALAPLAADSGRQSGGLVLRARDKDGAGTESPDAAEAASGPATANGSA
jgi:hypothetical protein